MTTFLVERYLPGRPDALSDSVIRVAHACAGARERGVSIRYLQSVFVPDEDTCFCLFESSSADEVRVVNTGCDFPFDRIVAALSMPIPAPCPRARGEHR